MYYGINEISDCIFGAVRTVKTERGARFFKCTEKVSESWKKHSSTLGERTLVPTGVRLDMETDSKSFSFTAFGGSFELLIDGKLICRVQESERSSGGESKCFELGAGQKRITLVFPSHDVCPEFCGIALSDGASFCPHKYDGKILFFGDSITQGWNSGYDSISYAWQTMLRLNADCVINGVGGSYYAKDTFDKPEFDPDTVIVAYGTNDYFHYKTLDEMSSNCREFLELVKQSYADKRVLVITPVWSIKYEDTQDSGKIDRLREIIKSHALSFGFEVIDGAQLVPNNSDFYADELHPNALGFCMYANTLVKTLSNC